MNEGLIYSKSNKKARQCKKINHNTSLAWNLSPLLGQYRHLRNISVHYIWRHLKLIEDRNTLQSCLHNVNDNLFSFKFICKWHIPLDFFFLLKRLNGIQNIHQIYFRTIEWYDNFGKYIEDRNTCTNPCWHNLNVNCFLSFKLIWHILF